jgi:uncharacterized membrane protein YphA (DoxX/SURF4 family)
VLIASLGALDTISDVILSLLGLTTVLCGICVGIGFFMPLVGTIVAALALAFLGAHLWTQGLIGTADGILLFELGIAIALILTGPGAYSIDARRFGHHEIRIPPLPPSARDE